MVSETLLDKLERLDQQAQALTEAVQHAATKRSSVSLAVAIVAVFLMLVAATVERSLSAHSDCERGNELRAAVDTIDRVRAGAFLAALISASSNGKTPEQVARAQEAGQQVQAQLDSDPQLQAARVELEPRHCSFFPF